MTKSAWKVLFTLILLAVSQHPAGRQGWAAGPPTLDEITKQMEEQHRQMEKRQGEEMERLKKDSPSLYEERKGAMARQNKINEIVSSFYQHSLSLQEAQEKLYPIVRDQMRADIAGLGQKIADLQKRLDFLKKTRGNPDLLVQKRIDGLLGQSMPSPDEMI